MPSAKKQKRSTNSTKFKAKKVVGKTSPLQDLALDIFLEIINLLEPAALVNLAETSKSIRGILLNKAFARSVWRAALGRSCELFLQSTEIIEPEIARLAFKLQCQRCGDFTEIEPLWALRARYCLDCSRAVTIRKIPVRVSRLIEGGSSLGDVFPMAECRYDKAQVAAFADIYKTLESEKDRADLITAQQSSTRALEQDVLPLIDWSQDSRRITTGRNRREKIAKEEEEEFLRLNRWKQVKENLTVLGWGEELSKLSDDLSWDLEQMECVNIPKNLTPNEWRTAKQKVVAFMEKAKLERFHRENFHVFTEAFKTLRRVFETLNEEARDLQPDIYYPRIQDFCRFPEVKQMMDVELQDLPTYETLETNLRPIFSKLIEKWRAERTSHISRIIVDHLRLPEGVNPFELVCAQLKCRRCNKFAVNPELLSHDPRCFYDKYAEHKYHHRVAQPKSYEHRVYDLFGDPAQMPFDFDREALMRRKDLLQLLGMKFDSTFEEMKKADTRLICRFCPKSNRPVLTWDQALDHFASNHPRGVIVDYNVTPVKLPKSE